MVTDTLSKNGLGMSHLQVARGGLDPKRNLGVNKYLEPDEWNQRGLPPIRDSNCSSATVGVTPMITAVVVVGTVTWMTPKH